MRFLAIEPQLIMWVGILGGLVGACVGSYCSIKNAIHTKARAFMIKTVVYLWIVCVAFVVALNIIVRFLPNPIGWVIFGILMSVWGLGLPFVILRINQRLRELENDLGK